MVTKLEDLKKIADGIEIELPGWDEKPLVCKAKRPSFMKLMAGGEIPNELLNEAYILFNGATKNEKVNVKDQYRVMKIVAEATLVEPSVKEIEEIGLELTDRQLTEIYNFAAAGVKMLSSFRKKQEDIKGAKDKH